MFLNKSITVGSLMMMVIIIPFFFIVNKWVDTYNRYSGSSPVCVYENWDLVGIYYQSIIWAGESKLFHYWNLTPLYTHNILLTNNLTITNQKESRERRAFSLCDGDNSVDCRSKILQDLPTIVQKSSTKNESFHFSFKSFKTTPQTNLLAPNWYLLAPN